MATRRYKVSPGSARVTEGVGAAVDSDVVEVTVELANTAVNDGSGTRTVTRQEVLEALDKVRDHIITGNWPPA